MLINLIGAALTLIGAAALERTGAVILCGSAIAIGMVLMMNEGWC